MTALVELTDAPLELHTESVRIELRVLQSRERSREA
ncbi:hypothetical protein PF005_g18831 [Phytophthora fragariae]|uniref:Uncharacterized protein n=2 Tax=Phytophthora TaxID=4783 RepID=A0A6A3X3F2_9STRA|nr:hypothetical protein PF003_g11618 [Phytophthora fragariae]KAE8988220.1 hypothetical protein PR002_g21830 [Phytophthora rubi]KAE8930156.1 hypothetical protein PF009_g19748 [Phytophthora fragariae]KAE8992949.1 hypothetical protein PR001_g20802 [Phytophthora rubi]KAE9091618.1 hypothetical protein PF010_g18126 [Phytophthora fragariae]